MNNRYAPVIAKLQRRSVEDLQVKNSLDGAHLRKIEAQLGHHLPDDYREFLRDFAGVVVSPAWFPYLAGPWPTEGDLFMFYGSSDEHTLADNYFDGIKNYCMDDGYAFYPGLALIRNIDEPVDEMGWPEELLRIGSDRGGNEICLALSGLRPGAIFYWIHSPGDVYLIANNFDEFMHLLQPG